MQTLQAFRILHAHGIRVTLLDIPGCRHWRIQGASEHGHAHGRTKVQAN